MDEYLNASGFLGVVSNATLSILGNISPVIHAAEHVHSLGHIPRNGMLGCLVHTSPHLLGNVRVAKILVSIYTTTSPLLAPHP